MKESSSGDHDRLFIAGTGNYRRNFVAPHDVLAGMVKDSCANIITALPIFRSSSSLLILSIVRRAPRQENPARQPYFYGTAN
jgi:hypothetical protein